MVSWLSYMGGVQWKFCEEYFSENTGQGIAVCYLLLVLSLWYYKRFVIRAYFKGFQKSSNFGLKNLDYSPSYNNRNTRIYIIAN